MHAYTLISFPSGHLYEVPTQIIADNRTAYYLKHDASASADSVKAETAALFASEHEVASWALDNMNWDEIEPHARLVRFKLAERDLGSASCKFADAPAIVGEIGADQVMHMPAEMLITSMAASGQACSIAVLNGANEQPFAAFVVLHGRPEVVNEYIKGLQMITAAIAAVEPQVPPLH